MLDFDTATGGARGYRSARPADVDIAAGGGRIERPACLADVDFAPGSFKPRFSSGMECSNRSSTGKAASRPRNSAKADFASGGSSGDIAADTVETDEPTTGFSV